MLRSRAAGRAAPAAAARAADNKTEIPSSTAPPPAAEPAASSGSSSESGDGGYYEVFGMKVSKDDLVTIGLAIAISYGIRWWGGAALLGCATWAGLQLRS